MYKLIIVDDERIIREGMAFSVDWEKVDMKVVGLADDGNGALELIKERSPDVVITDIKMPEKSGLDLIREVKESTDKQIEFVVLSGYNDFEFAQEAMKYGVRDYLLKPTSKEKIYETMSAVRDRIESRTKKDEVLRELSERLRRQESVIRTQFIRDYITNSYVDQNDFDYYKKYFDFDNCHVRTVMFSLGKNVSVDILFSLKHLIEMNSEDDKVFMSFSIKDQVVQLLDDVFTDEELTEYLKRMTQVFHEYYDYPIRIIYSKANPLSILPYIYRRINRCTHYGMYLSEEYIISMEETLEKTETDIDSETELDNFDEILSNIASGDEEKTRESIEKYFRSLSVGCMDADKARMYISELYMSIMRCNPHRMQNYMENINTFMNSLGSLSELRTIITDTAVNIAEKNYQVISDRYSETIEKALKYIDANISNANLSMKSMCNNVLFINRDYFGRLFRKEMGEKFTDYVANKRIAKAKRMLESHDCENIYDIAEKCGFGDGVQYFSRMFKKATGYSPTEYRERLV